MSLYSYPLFVPEARTLFGGSEVRVATIAREVARRGNFEVSVVVFDHGQPRDERRDGIRFVPVVGELPEPVVDTSAPEPFKPSRRLRRAYERASPLKRALLRIPIAAFDAYAAAARLRARIARRARAPGTVGAHPVDRARFEAFERADADVYVVHGPSALGAEAAFFCRVRGRKLVFLAGSDGDYDPAFRLRPDAPGPYGHPGSLLAHSIDAADLHVVQTEHQARLLAVHFGRESVVLRNPFDRDRRMDPSPVERSILWIGKSDAIKRPEIALKLAADLPDCRFTLILNPQNPEVQERCEKIATDLPNVALERFVPFAEMDLHFARAMVFLNTSTVEGFPNTFLQAAKYGVPIVSLRVDPGGMLSTFGLGRVAGDRYEGMRDDVRLLLDSPDLRRQISLRGAEYLETHHDKERIVSGFEAAIRSVLERTRPATGSAASRAP